MKRSIVVLSIIVALTAGIAAAQEPVSCISPSNECKPASQIYGPTFCPNGWTPSLEACPVVAPPATEPPAPPAEFEPKPIDVPGWVVTVIGYFSQHKTLPIPFAALLGAVLIPLIGVLRQLLATFGTKLGPRTIFIATAVLGLLGAFANAASDGAIAGDEWLAVITGLGGALAAFFGYKLIFSDSAKRRITNA